MKRLTGRNKETGEAYLFNGIGGVNDAIERLAQYEDAEEVEKTTYKACLGTQCIPCEPTFPECKFCEFSNKY